MSFVSGFLFLISDMFGEKNMCFMVIVLFLELLLCAALTSMVFNALCVVGCFSMVIGYAMRCCCFTL